LQGNCGILQACFIGFFRFSLVFLGWHRLCLEKFRNPFDRRGESKTFRRQSLDKKQQYKRISIKKL
jgi:hypothetical protein